MQEYLTSKEVADLLRIKERKLYDLCAEGVLPVTKVTGKLIFPRHALMTWLRENTEYGQARPSLRVHPPVVAGSHDPLLDWALRASGSGLATYFDGSTDGLMRMKSGQALCAGMHIHGAEDMNANISCIISEMPFEPVILVEWAKRSQGLVIRPDETETIRSIADLTGRRVVLRQTGAGSRVLMEALLGNAGISAQNFTVIAETARNESDVAQAVASGHADAGLSVEAVARQYRLAFVPLAVERFDLLIWRRDFFESPMQKLFSFCSKDIFRQRADDLGGYNVSENGTVHYNGP